MGSLSRVGYAQRVCPSPRPNYFSFIAVSAYTSTAQSPPLSYLQRPFQLYVPSYCQLGIVHILHNHFLVSNWSPQLIQLTTVGKFGQNGFWYKGHRSTKVGLLIFILGHKIMRQMFYLAFKLDCDQMVRFLKIEQKNRYSPQIFSNKRSPSIITIHTLAFGWKSCVLQSRA